MKPSYYIDKNIPTLKERLKLAYKVLDTYLSIVEVESVLKRQKNEN